MQPKLFFSTGSQKGNTVEIRNSVTKIGRSSKNDITIADEEVSRFHAEIRKNRSAVMIVDSGSSNGTFLNGERIYSAELRNGDRIQVGKSEILYTDSTKENEADSDLVVQISRDFDSSDQISSQKKGGGITRVSETMDSSDSSRSGETPPRVPLVVAKTQSSVETILETLEVIFKSTDEKTLLKEVLKRILDLTSADRGSILLYCSQTKDFMPVVTMLREETRGSKERMRVSETIINYVVQAKQSVLTKDAQDDDRWNESDSLAGASVNEAICAPLQGRQGILGLVYVDTQVNIFANSKDKPRFSQSLLEIVSAIAQQAALALEVSRYYSAMIANERMATIGQMTAMISHNVKNTMQGINSGAYLIENGLTTKTFETIQRGWKTVSDHQERILQMLKNILSYGKHQDPVRSPTDVFQVIQKVVTTAKPYADIAGVRLATHSKSEKFPMLTLDDHGVFDAVLNLVLNAIDACETRPNSEVNLSVNMTNDKKILEINIEDNGIGIPLELQSKVMQDFFTSKGKKGNGLGLMSARKSIEEQNGTIEFVSKPNVGTRFTIRLPIV